MAHWHNRCCHGKGTLRSLCSSQQWNIPSSICNVANIFVWFWWNFGVLDRFYIRNHYQISLKSIQGEPSSCMRRDMTKLIDALCDYGNTLKMKDFYHTQYTFFVKFYDLWKLKPNYSTTCNLCIFNSHRLSRHTWRLSKFQPFVHWHLSALYIKIQSVPHREHSVLSLKKHSVKAVSINSTCLLPKLFKHISTLCGKLEIFLLLLWCPSGQESFLFCKMSKCARTHLASPSLGFWSPQL